jgi:hypothetical protein
MRRVMKAARVACLEVLVACGSAQRPATAISGHAGEAAPTITGAAPPRAVSVDETTVAFDAPVRVGQKELTACLGRTIHVIVPAWQGSDWRLVRMPAPFPEPVKTIVPGWLGPQTPGLELSWDTSGQNSRAFSHLRSIGLEDASTHTRVWVNLNLWLCS